MAEKWIFSNGAKKNVPFENIVLHATLYLIQASVNKVKRPQQQLFFSFSPVVTPDLYNQYR